MYLQSNNISHSNTGQQKKKKQKHINSSKKQKIFNSAKKAYRKWNVTMKQSTFDVKNTKELQFLAFCKTNPKSGTVSNCSI